MTVHRAKIKTDQGEMSAAQLGITPPANAAALTFTPAGTIAATTVQAAIEEVATEAGAGGGVTVKDEGSTLTTAATTLDFVGSGVVASGTGATKTVTITGGSSTVLLAATAPALTSGSPTPITTNTTSEQALFTTTITAAQIAAGDLLSFDYSFDSMNNSAGAVTLTWRVRLGGIGGTAIMASPAISLGNNGTNRYKSHGRISLYVNTLTDQRLGFTMNYTGAGTENIRAVNTGFMLSGAGVSTVDMSTDKDLVLTLQLGTASAAVEFRPIFAGLSRSRA